MAGTARRAAPEISSWVGGSGESPAAGLEMKDTAAISIPAWRAATASVAVDMPTASAPSVFRALTSAGGSNWGPAVWA